MVMYMYANEVNYQVIITWDKKINYNINKHVQYTLFSACHVASS